MFHLFTILVLSSQLPTHSSGDSGRERVKQFTFDHSYWSVERSDSHYASQAQVRTDDVFMSVADEHHLE